MDRDTEVVDAGRGTAERRLRRRRQILVLPLALAAVVLLGLAIVAGVTEWRRVPEPHAFRDKGGAYGGFDRPYVPGTAYSTEIVVGVLPSVVMHKAEPMVAAGSAPAAVTVSVCQAKPGRKSASATAEVGDLATQCSAVLPVNDQDLGRLGSRDSLVLTVVPLAAGVVSIEGVELTYEQGGQQTTERLPADFVIEG